MKMRYKNVTVDPDRHGKLRARFRKAGMKPVYMKYLPDQPGFQAGYDALKSGAAPAIESREILAAPAICWCGTIARPTSRPRARSCIAGGAAAC